MTSERSGRFRPKVTGYEGFIPKPPPPDPRLQRDAELLDLLYETTTALERLDGMAATLPDSDRFVASNNRHSRLASLQIGNLINAYFGCCFERHTPTDANSNMQAKSRKDAKPIVVPSEKPASITQTDRPAKHEATPASTATNCGVAANLGAFTGRTLPVRE